MCKTRMRYWSSGSRSSRLHCHERGNNHERLSSSWCGRWSTRRLDNRILGGQERGDLFTEGLELCVKVATCLCDCRAHLVKIGTCGLDLLIEALFGGKIVSQLLCVVLDVGRDRGGVGRG